MTRDSLLDIYNKDIGKCPRLDAKTEFLLWRRIEGGDGQAVDLCVKSLLPMVLKYATRAKKRYPRAELMDLIQGGNLGLMTAIRKFRPEKKFRLSSYAFAWIKYYIDLAGEAERFMEIPRSTLIQIAELEREVDDFRKRFGRRPSLNYLSKSLGWRLDRLKEVMGAMINIKNESLVFGDKEFGLGHLVPDRRFTSPDIEAHSNLLREKILKILSSFGKKKAEVVKQLFGLGCKPASMSAVGQNFKITPQAISEIKKEIMKKLYRDDHIFRLAMAEGIISKHHE